MAEPIAWLNGRYLPYAEARLPVDDLGLVQGAAVTEMVRTFRHRLFRLEEHLDRLFRSLALAGFGQDLSQDTLREIAVTVIEHNSRLIAPDADLGLTMFVTPGLAATYSLAAAATPPFPPLLRGGKGGCGPTVCVPSFPLPFHLWAERCLHGQHLVVPPLRQIPGTS
ncbi:MAG: aminotransferase class IV, partial [Planctomycetes bacterium]|nr:aminotransferase class IV [Planctomycetota bacterium]